MWQAPKRLGYVQEKNPNNLILTNRRLPVFDPVHRRLYAVPSGNSWTHFALVKKYGLINLHEIRQGISVWRYQTIALANIDLSLNLSLISPWWRHMATLSLGHHSLRYWLVVRWHQSNTWKSCDIQLSVGLKETPKAPVIKVRLKIEYLKLRPELPAHPKGNSSPYQNNIKPNFSW